MTETAKSFLELPKAINSLLNAGGGNLVIDDFGENQNKCLTIKGIVLNEKDRQEWI